MTTPDDDLNSTLQQRADYIPLEQLKAGTSNSGELFQLVYKELTNRALRTIVGPRGCGKTHMMRYAWLQCSELPTLPFAIYVSFNRYFRLEPLLSSHPGAIQQFHSWVLARILIAIGTSIVEWKHGFKSKQPVLFGSEFPLDQLSSFVTRIERNQPLDEANLALSDSLSIDKVQDIIDKARQMAGRKFTILLMDDAALTLTPDYLIEFLDIVRSLKSTTIAPKASVYPGTTEVSPKFHQGQDSIPIPVWISINDVHYDNIMQDIAGKRVNNLEKIPPDAQAMLRFASFGIPRAYLTMLEEYQRGGFRNAQQGVNKIIQEHLDARIAEYRSLGKKVPKFEQIIVAGEKIINGIAKEIKTFNETTLISRQEKELTYGVREDELTPIVERMFKLLVEAGLIFDDGNVKHGTPARIYRRFIPHTSLLLSIRAIDSGGSGGAIKQILDAIAFKTTKHPLRKSLSKMAPDVNLQGLDFSLPKCTSCGTRRLTDSQRFCHNCGHQLVDASTFNQCLDTEINNVPGLTTWQRSQFASHLPNLRTIRDFLAKQDPAADLLTVRGFGKRRTAKIVDVLNSFVDDYLS
ncbi:MAG: zinc ribbon domain-containing protein [Deltaproteobacteria bacterium]|nr:zinc ribbon domain-containing protein [Deltaproteobacteria bacterium]TLN00670.1 MAG: zinc ribbon domain-containing protein [bacterium]